ncbi:hypothetical protein A3K82_02045 [Candidatus Pacearchaeota archaeon RBG_19FT_COMBO_34_9]|nr:MAG: hypothetical protein A3K82_02045 [Candidatus Pacearchaeota archaeon RBG_19FT_COMBO_34_9]OGJ15919.1 MAG: hypothetical protein A3K74_02360 [Candidatus Pacearchaeota archaeon RBG_13_33_26]
MKIAIITDAIYPFTLGGSEIRNHKIAKRLVKRGHEVHIYGAKLWKGEDIKKIDGVVIHGVSDYQNLYNKKGKRKPGESLFLSLKTFSKLLKEDYDLIDNASFVYFNCYLTKLISIIKKKPLVFTWHQYFGDYLKGYFGKLKGTIAMLLERGSVSLSKNNIAVSSQVKSELEKRKAKGRIDIVYNGTDTKLAGKVKASQKKYDLIFAGRLNYQKNLKLLVYSANLLKKDFPDLKICIIGSGEEKRKLQDLIHKLRLDKNFFFAGEIKDKKKVFELMKSSKIFVLPSLMEGFPLTLIEANACGLPVIATKTKHNNISEYIKENENGILCLPTPESFSKAISLLLKNKQVREKMSKEGIKKAKDYDWEKITDRQEEYYKRIIQRKI